MAIVAVVIVGLGFWLPGPFYQLILASAHIVAG